MSCDRIKTKRRSKIIFIYFFFYHPNGLTAGENTRVPIRFMGLRTVRLILSTDDLLKSHRKTTLVLPTLLIFGHI